MNTSAEYFTKKIYWRNKVNNQEEYFCRYGESVLTNDIPEECADNIVNIVFILPSDVIHDNSVCTQIP